MPSTFIQEAESTRLGDFYYYTQTQDSMIQVNIQIQTSVVFYINK